MKADTSRAVTRHFIKIEGASQKFLIISLGEVESGRHRLNLQINAQAA